MRTRGTSIFHCVICCFSKSASLFNQCKPRSQPASAAIWNCSFAFTIGSSGGLSTFFPANLVGSFLFLVNLLRASGTGAPDSQLRKHHNKYETHDQICLFQYIIILREPPERKWRKCRIPMTQAAVCISIKWSERCRLSYNHHKTYVQKRVSILK